MKSQRGFSLVELMVAVVLGLLVTDGVVSMFTSVRSASRTTSGVAAVADNGRFALNFIQQALRSAGAMGCNSTLRQANIVSAGPSPIYTDFNEALGGYEASGTGPTGNFTITLSPAGDGNASDWSTTAALGSQLDALLLGAAVRGSDVLVVHETLPSLAPTYLIANAVNATTFTVGSSAGFAAGQIGVLTDCISSWAFEIGGAAAGIVNLGGGNAQASLPATYAVGAQLTVADTLVYFIGVGKDGDGALFVADSQGTNAFAAPQELVPDIENMQVLYGVDTTGSKAASQYVTADQVAIATNGALGNFNSVISVKVALLSASPPNASTGLPPAVNPTFNLFGTTVTVPADTRLRQVFSATIATRNTTS